MTKNRIFALIAALLMVAALLCGCTDKASSSYESDTFELGQSGMNNSPWD